MFRYAMRRAPTSSKNSDGARRGGVSGCPSIPVQGVAKKVKANSGSGTGSDLRGHNVRGVTVTIEVRLFNSLHKYGGIKGAAIPLSLPAGSSVGDILQKLDIPADKVFLALRNGRDITPSLHTKINTEAALDEGDVIALSGPVPYSWGYGSPVV